MTDRLGQWLRMWWCECRRWGIAESELEQVAGGTAGAAGVAGAVEVGGGAGTVGVAGALGAAGAAGVAGAAGAAGSVAYAPKDSSRGG